VKKSAMGTSAAAAPQLPGTSVLVPAAGIVFLQAAVLFVVVACTPNDLLVDVQQKVQETQGRVSTPVFSLTSGVYNTDVSVSITDPTPGAAIHFTTDGSAPTSSSPVYGSPIPVSGDGVTATIAAMGTRDGMRDSETATQHYSIAWGSVAAPQFVPNGGVFAPGGAGVEISCSTPGAILRYTTDGSTPTKVHGTQCSSGQVINVTASMTLKGIAFAAGSRDSDVSAADYAVQRVYTAGYWNDTVTDIPCYWVGTQKIDLSADGHNSRATAIFVSSGTVYTAGYCYNGAMCYPCYWTGTTRTDLPLSGTSGAAANAITVSNGTVYTAGYIQNNAAMSGWYAVGTAVTTLSAGTASQANSIAVSNGTVYTAGWYQSALNGATACFWSGSSRTDLSGSKAAGIFVSGSTPYTSGYYVDSNGRYYPSYWTGTTRTTLLCPLNPTSASVMAGSIFVANGTVYTAGYDNTSAELPCRWVGTSRTDLPCGSGGNAFSIVVSLGVPYVAGWYKNGSAKSACYWTGMARTELPGPLSEAHSIVVQ
jgi:hypothetical protein